MQYQNRGCHMNPPRLTCPCCHVSVPMERFEKAFTGRDDYLVCSRCGGHAFWFLATALGEKEIQHNRWLCRRIVDASNDRKSDVPSRNIAAGRRICSVSTGRPTSAHSRVNCGAELPKFGLSGHTASAERAAGIQPLTDVGSDLSLRVCVLMSRTRTTGPLRQFMTSDSAP